LVKYGEPDQDFAGRLIIIGHQNNLAGHSKLQKERGA
jgi:hypothetical protein